MCDRREQIMPWFYTVNLRGHGQRDKTSMTFQLDTVATPLADYVGARTAATQIRGALVDITDAFVTKETVSEVFFEDNQRPPDNVDVYEEAAVACYLNDPTEAEKLHTIRIPAPVDALFTVDGETVDVSNAQLIQYVQQLQQHAYVSDEEQINVSADNGIKYGYKRTKAKRFRGK